MVYEGKPLKFQSFLEFSSSFFLVASKNNFRMMLTKNSFWVKRQSITQPLNFSAGDLKKVIWFIWPPEILAVQALHQDPESGAIPLQHFYQGLPFIAEGKQATRVGIQLKT